VQHIGTWSAISRKYGLDLSFPPSQPQASPSPPAEAKEGKEEGEKVYEAKAKGKKEGEGGEKKGEGGKGINLKKTVDLLKTILGAGGIPTELLTVPARVRKAYEAESEAILSHQTLISFMRDDSEVGWLFGPRLVGPHR
jgi:hypothetical protein